MPTINGFIIGGLFMIPALGLVRWWKHKTGRKHTDEQSYPLQMDHSKDSLEKEYIKINNLVKTRI